MNKKQIYEAPDAELFVLRFEENILSAGTAGNGYNGEGNNLGDLDDDGE